MLFQVWLNYFILFVNLSYYEDSVIVSIHKKLAVFRNKFIMVKFCVCIELITLIVCLWKL